MYRRVLVMLHDTNFNVAALHCEVTIKVLLGHPLSASRSVGGDVWESAIKLITQKASQCMIVLITRP